MYEVHSSKYFVLFIIAQLETTNTLAGWPAWPHMEIILVFMLMEMHVLVLCFQKKRSLSSPSTTFYIRNKDWKNGRNKSHICANTRTLTLTLEHPLEPSHSHLPRVFSRQTDEVAAVIQPPRNFIMGCKKQSAQRAGHTGHSASRMTGWHDDRKKIIFIFY